MLVNIRKTDTLSTETISPCDSHHYYFFFFRSLTHNNKSRLTVDIPRHLGLMHTFKVSSTAHTQEKQLKCTVNKREIRY